MYVCKFKNKILIIYWGLSAGLFPGLEEYPAANISSVQECKLQQ